MYYNVIFYQIFVLSILVLIGYITGKAKVITADVNKGLATIIYNVTLPLLIGITFTDMTLTTDLVKNSLLVFTFSYLILFILFFVGRFSAFLQKMSPESSAVHVMHTMFGNIVFLGFPLINALFPGGEALLYAAVFQVASDSVMWTFGIYILNHHQKNKFKDYLKHFINPNTMAFVIGIIFLFLNIKIPSIIHKPLYDLGHTTIFLSMLYIGAMLSFIKLKHISNIMYNITLTINKLFIFPIILLFLFFIAINYYGLTMSPMAISVLILQCGMPAMATVVILVKNYKGDDVQATINVFISTIVCLVSLPLLWVLICKFILKS